MYWLLDKNVYFLNHGSFGATPIPVLAYQDFLRKRLESQPLHFLARELQGLLDTAKIELANFVGTKATNLAFIPNATFGVNSVLRSLCFEPGEEILVNNHTYNACRNAVEFVANRWQAKIVVAHIPFPLNSTQDIIEPILNGVSSRTRLALLDHITSPTALIFPIKTLVSELAKRGVDTLVDGAHAPGFLELNIDDLGCAYYTGNCHKWLCAPKGSAFLFVRPDKQSQIRPLIISHGANAKSEARSLFQLEFDWLGTDDPTAYLSVPKAIKFMGGLLPGGWQELQQRNRNLTLEARNILCETLGVTPPCPDEMIGLMAAVSLGNLSKIGVNLYEQLLQEFNIEVPIIPWKGGDYLIRISAQFYNSLEQYQYLADKLRKFANF